MFSDEFLDSLPENPIQAAYDMCTEYLKLVEEDYERNKDPFDESVQRSDITYDNHLEAFGAFQAFCEANNLIYEFPILSESIEYNTNVITKFFVRTHDELQKETTDINVSRYKDKYAARFGGRFTYEFTEGDINRLQELVNELRVITTNSGIFDVRYKERLLKKIEALQSEINKKMLTLDRFYGFVGDFGVVLGKFGDDAKPFTDCIKDIMRIVWRTQARAEELESGHPHPLLGTGEKETDE